MKNSHLAIALSLSLLAACSNKPQGELNNEQSYAAATQSLNERNYPQAVKELEELRSRHPKSKEILRKLMHAYAGLAGFEAASFKDRMERLAEKSKRYKGKSFKDEYDSFRHDLRAAKKLDPATLQKFKLYRGTGELRALLEDVPSLSKEQFAHLNHAIRLYEEMEPEAATNSPDDNFRWGTLHAYRVVVTLKHTVNALDDVARDPRGKDRGDLERLFIEAGDRMWSDALSSYRLFKNSYAKVQGISAAVDTFVTKATGARLRTELLGEARDVSDILAGFAADNKEYMGVLVARFENFADTLDVDAMMKEAFSEFRDESPEVQYRKMRIRAITQVFIEELKENRRDDLNEAKYLSQNFFRELQVAFAEAKRIKKLAPLQALLREQRGEVHRVVEIGRLLLNDVKDAGLEAELKPHVLALRDRVDREQLRVLQADAEALFSAAKELGMDYREGLADLSRIAEVRLRARAKSTEALLNDQLADEYRAFRESLAQKDAELDAGFRKQKDELRDISTK